MSKNNSNAMLFKGNFPSCTDFFNKLGVLIDGDFKFGVLLLVFVRFLGGDTGNLLKVDRVFISFMFKSVNLSILQKTIKKQAAVHQI
jgi:hypothetical protein